jgi:hypothetical protein
MKSCGAVVIGSGYQPVLDGHMQDILYANRQNTKPIQRRRVC